MTAHVGVVPAHAPAQFVNVALATGVAVIVTTWPAGYAVIPLGAVVPGPVTVTPSVYCAGAGLAGTVIPLHA